MALTTEDINSIYRQSFGRDADKGGLEYWSNQAKSQGISDVDALRKSITGGAKGYDVVAAEDKANYKSAWDSKLNPNRGDLLYDANKDRWMPSTQPEPPRPATYTPTTRQINKKTDTAQGQITGLLEKSNPYMKRAEAKGLSYANSRGLLNSGMAAGAAHGAAIDAALPIAQQDASTYTEQGFRNQDASNQAGMFNASAQNDFSLAQMDIGSRERMQQSEIASREQIAQWDRDVRENIASIEMDAQTRAQFLESTNELMQQYQIQFQEIATNPDLSGDARDAAWRDLREMYDEQIKLSGDMMGVPLTRGDYDVNEGTSPWNVGGTGEGEQDSVNPPEGGGTQPPITSRDGNTPILAEEAGLIQQKPAQAVRDYAKPDTIPRDMRGYESFGVDTLYAKENGTYPTPQDLEQTEPPQGESFGPWLQSRASRFWRYKNPEVAVSSGGQPLRAGDLSSLERQVFDDIPGLIRARNEEAQSEEGY